MIAKGIRGQLLLELNIDYVSVVSEQGAVSKVVDSRETLQTSYDAEKKKIMV
ncbi:hypothetical protein ACJJI4_00930 [Microbulbifer sp. TRSA002]|uniref:hypothetical protein n=1 Tax=Microbulbifer sp. TRSA002 TaxID=3243382 RepID=UPI00403A37D2